MSLMTDGVVYGDDLLATAREAVALTAQFVAQGGRDSPVMFETLVATLGLDRPYAVPALVLALAEAMYEVLLRAGRLDLTVALLQARLV